MTIYLFTFSSTFNLNSFTAFDSKIGFTSLLYSSRSYLKNKLPTRSSTIFKLEILEVKTFDSRSKYEWILLFNYHQNIFYSPQKTNANTMPFVSMLRFKISLYSSGQTWSGIVEYFECVFASRQHFSDSPFNWTCKIDIKLFPSFCHKQYILQFSDRIESYVLYWMAFHVTLNCWNV